MFHLLRLAIWIAGIAVIVHFGLRYFGYDINWNYWNEQKADCQQKLVACQKDLLATGINGAKQTCAWDCVDPKILIRKQPTDSGNK